MKRNKRGEESDKILLGTIRENPGLSMYELAKKLKWKTGRVDGTVRRLLNANKVFIRILERNGRRVNLVYPKEYKPSNRIEVPVELLGNPAWSERAFIYALDSSTIGISSHEVPEWKEEAGFMEEIPIKKSEGKVVLQVPEKFRRFYGLERKHRVVSVNGENILITVSGNIVEEKKYPS